ncbi:glutaredoxin family protein [Arthrobacter sp. zg-Y859]|uniref:Glutaredoxin family protein n=1 Tax=Arthrobacter jinronghuae TaxID=2964609 RepID=A0ABT1NMZ5_9MICC|nr:glutaredoxin family protein [Arthrobacter jinronghuae]MCQ1949084.1 glutaredoxin family protein [Arthrobacter jinronghuae]UWX78123.1 glutaredoxin family protein [Arthrobacter jinronghuae]
MSESVGPEVVLLTRPGCHLCEDARLVLRRVGEDLGMSWQERSAEEDPELAARFGEEIPVLFIDGVQRDFWKIDEARLRRLLGA